MIMGTSVFLGIIFFSLSGALIPIRKIIIIRSSLLAPVSIYFLPSQTCNKQSDRLMRCKFSLMILMKLIRKCLLRFFFSFPSFFTSTRPCNFKTSCKERYNPGIMCTVLKKIKKMFQIWTFTRVPNLPADCMVSSLLSRRMTHG